MGVSGIVVVFMGSFVMLVLVVEWGVVFFMLVFFEDMGKSFN